MLIRPRSALGLKYVELTRGTSDEGFEDGDTIPLAQATPAPVEFDEFVNMFDEDTRAASQANLQRLRRRVRRPRRRASTRRSARCRPLLRDIIPVAQNLSSAETNLPRFIGELADAARIVAPAAETQAQLFVNLDRTFGALREVARPYIQESISEGPETLDAGDRAASPSSGRSWPTPRACSASCGRACARCARAAPDLADALEVGTPTLRRTPPFNRAARLAARPSSQTFAEDPLVPRGIRAADRHGARRSTRRCSTSRRRRRPATTSRSGSATSPRCCPRATSTAPGSGSSSSPRRRARTTRAARRRRPPNGPTLENHLHTNPYPNTASPGQPRECEAGNEPYLAGRTVTSQRARHAAGRDGGEALMARPPPPPRGRSPFAVGLIALVVIGDPRRSSASRRTSRSRAATRSRRCSSPPTACGPTRRCGSPASRSARSSGRRARRARDNAVVTMEIDDDRAAAARGRDGEDPPAHLPRGQLLRRPAAGHAGRARARRRRHDQGHADRDAGPARPGADRAAVRHAPGPARRARGPRHRR